MMPGVMADTAKSVVVFSAHAADFVWRAGGTIALPKMPIPGMGWLAYCKDTEGNIFGMMQSDPNAK